MPMPSFQHVSPALRVYSGASSLQQLGRELARLQCHRAVIFCGSTLARSPLLDLVRAAVGDRYAGAFTGVRAHSPRATVEEAVAELRQLHADAVVAVGGGSAVVTARAASILLAEEKDLEALSTSVDAQGQMQSPRLNASKLPQLIVPTTPNTAVVKAGSAVFDPVSGNRCALFDPKTRAQALFIHPDFLMSAPRELVLTAGLDTLSLSIEGLTSRSGEPLSDALLIHAVRLLSKDLPRLEKADDAELRADLALAAVLTGRGTDHTGAGITTVLGHAIGAAHNIENGVAKSIVLPHALLFNAAAAHVGLQKVATALGSAPTGSGLLGGVADALKVIFSSVGTPARLRDVGVPRTALLEIARQGMSDWFLRGNPRPINGPSELLEVLEAAW
jgi:alcohol dehydrogenase class IV